MINAQQNTLKTLETKISELEKENGVLKQAVKLKKANYEAQEGELKELTYKIELYDSSLKIAESKMVEKELENKLLQCKIESKDIEIKRLQNEINSYREILSPLRRSTIPLNSVTEGHGIFDNKAQSAEPNDQKRDELIADINARNPLIPR